MKKVIRMTEADLTRLVKRVIQEQTKDRTPTGYGKDDPLTDKQLQDSVDTIVYFLDGWVDGTDMDAIVLTIGMLNNKYALDRTNPNRPIVVPALKRLADLYKMDENGDDLLKDLSSVGTVTLSNEAITKKMQTINMIKDALKTPAKPATTQKPVQPSGQQTTPPSGGSSPRPTSPPSGGSSPRPTSPTSRMPVR